MALVARIMDEEHQYSSVGRMNDSCSSSAIEDPHHYVHRCPFPHCHHHHTTAPTMTLPPLRRKKGGSVVAVKHEEKCANSWSSRSNHEEEEGLTSRGMAPEEGVPDGYRARVINYM